VRRLEGRRVAVYARYSTDKQNPRSIDDQVRLCSERITQLGGTIAAVFRDEAISGVVADRPGLDALKDAVRSGAVDVVVCEELSRIARDQEHLHGTLKRFSSWGARLIALDGYDTESESAELTASVRGMLGALELGKLRDRTRRGLIGRHEAGQSTGGKTYGYRSVSKDGAPAVPVIDTTEAEVVRRIFAWHIAGLGQREIAERLNREGVLSARGGKWGHTAIRAMLRNERYAGIVIFGRRQWLRDAETDKRRWRKRERSEWRRREAPELRIVDAETWEAAQRRMHAGASKRDLGRLPKRGYPLSGLLVCSLCSEPMTITAGGRYYACSGRKKGHGCSNRASLSEPAIRAWLIEQVMSALGADAVLDGLRADIARSIGEHDRSIRAELQQRRSTLSRLETGLGTLYDLIAEGDASPTLRAKIAEREDHAQLQRAAIAALEHRLRRVPVLPSRDELAGFLQALPALAAREPTEARAVLGRLCKTPVTCKPPEQSRGPYWARVELSAAGLLAQHAQGALYASGGCGGGFSPLAYAVVREGAVRGKAQ